MEKRLLEKRLTGKKVSGKTLIRVTIVDKGNVEMTLSNYTVYVTH